MKSFVAWWTAAGVAVTFGVAGCSVGEVTPPAGTSAAAVSSVPPGIARPGESLNPIDRGKTLDTGAFRYTLEDVRKDTATDLHNQPRPVYLVLLKAVRIGGQGIKSNAGVDVLPADIGVAMSNDPTAVLAANQGLPHDVFYDGEKNGAPALSPVNQDYPVGRQGEGYIFYNAAFDRGGKLYLHVGAAGDTVRTFAIR